MGRSERQQSPEHIRPVHYIQNFNGATALIYAATFGQTEIAKLLLEKGADKKIQDIRGNTAYMHAKFQGIPQLAELLEA